MVRLIQCLISIKFHYFASVTLTHGVAPHAKINLPLSNLFELLVLIKNIYDILFFKFHKIKVVPS